MRRPSRRAARPIDRAAPVSPAGADTGSPTPRRVVPPSAVLPDPATPVPPRPGAPAAALDAVAVRRCWPDVVGKVNRTNKRIAALMRDAVVRELDGDMLVLTVKSTVLAKMMADHAAVLTDALYEELGGRWQIRCEVAGERGGVSLSGPQRSQSAAPARPAAPPSAPDGQTSPASAPNPSRRRVERERRRPDERAEPDRRRVERAVAAAGPASASNPAAAARVERERRCRPDRARRPAGPASAPRRRWPAPGPLTAAGSNAAGRPQRIRPAVPARVPVLVCRAERIARGNGSGGWPRLRWPRCRPAGWNAAHRTC